MHRALPERMDPPAQRMAYPQSSEVRPPVTRRDATRTDVRVGAGRSDARRADVREE
jgi:hypothetical protein